MKIIKNHFLATLEKFHLREGNQDPGDPGMGKVRGRKGFFFPSSGGGPTLDDTMYMLDDNYTEELWLTDIDEKVFSFKHKVYN